MATGIMTVQLALEVQQSEDVCLFRLSGPQGLRLSAKLPYPDARSPPINMAGSLPGFLSAVGESAGQGSAERGRWRG
ncbi:MAG: hypothetical protein HC860_10075 [Alkalinema sp. RU_4_3]|nr:hypothetical protein [Alkalinema sp. RU_4_3]